MEYNVMQVMMLLLVIMMKVLMKIFFDLTPGSYGAKQIIEY